MQALIPLILKCQVLIISLVTLGKQHFSSFKTIKVGRLCDTDSIEANMAVTLESFVRSSPPVLDGKKT